MKPNEAPLGKLESWLELAFVMAGLLWLGFIGVSAYERHVLLNPHEYRWITESLLPIGWVCAYVGLLGFYTQVADAAPRLSRTSVVLVIIGLASILVERGGALVVGLASGRPFWAVTTGLEPLYAVVLTTTVMGFTLYGVASVRTGVPSRTIGGIFLVPAAVLPTHVALIVMDLLPNPILVEFGMIAIAMIAGAYVLRFKPTSSGTTGAQAESIH